MSPQAPIKELLFEDGVTLASAREQRFEADNTLLLSLGEILKVPKVEQFRVHYKQKRAGACHFTGLLQVELVLTCSLTLQTFSHTLQNDFNVCFVASKNLPQLEHDPLDCEPLDQKGYADLGNFLIGLVALEIPLFPRKQGAIFEPNAGACDPCFDQEKPRPFAVLATLKR